MKNIIIIALLLISHSACSNSKTKEGSLDDFIDNYCSLTPLTKENCEVYGLKLKKSYLSELSLEELEFLFKGSFLPDFKLLKSVLKLLKGVDSVVDEVLLQKKSRKLKIKDEPLAPIDFRNNGKVREDVVPINECNAGWAATAVEAVESRFFIKYSNYPFTPFSVQEIVDCSKNLNVPGDCKSGTPGYAFTYYLQAKNAVFDSAMKYEDAQKECRTSSVSTRQKARNVLSDIIMVENITPKKFYEYLKDGPIPVVVDATDKEFMLYSDGILRPSCDKPPAHPILIIGYGVENGIPFWIIKNNVKGWGQNGIGKLYMDQNYHSCGMYKKVVIPKGY